ncbi:MAG TPA: MMPL family transporter [Vicinamibacterales bacterium]|nr:MMPL family transporter [Vicinamibacterales bacterium]
MAVSFERVVIWAHRHRLLVLAGTAFLLALSAIGLNRVTFDANVLRLLPATGQAIPAFRDYLERFGTLDDLFVVFTAPDNHAIGEYEDEIAEWVDALREVPELLAVDSGRLDGSRDWEWLADRQLLLLDDQRLAEALARFRPDEMRTVLAATRELLAIPSPEITALVREDPLRLHELLQRQLGEQAGLRLSTRGYVSEDGQRRLVIARPMEPPYNTEFSHALLDRLTAIRQERSAAPPVVDGETLPELNVEFVGGHRIAVEAETIVKRESITNGVGSLALILPLLFVVFRSPWLLLIGAIPSATALLIAIGLLSLGGATLSAAATGASAMMFGLGVDGVVLLYVGYRHAIAAGMEPLAALRALGGPSASMLLGMWTTAATFLGLLVVDFPSLEQLGLLIGVGMLLCGVLTLVIVPAALPRAPRLSRVAERRWLTMPGLASAVKRHRVAILVAAGVLTLASVALVSTLRVNPTLERLRSVTPGALLLEQVTADFGFGGDVILVLDSGPDLQALLERNEQLVARIRRAAPSLDMHAPTTLLPSDRMQATRRRIVQESLPEVEVLHSSLDAATVDAGFRPGAFQSFGDRLTRLTSEAQRISFEDFADHGLDDVVRRFIARDEEQWALASYVFPRTPAELDSLRAAVRASNGSMVLSGLPLVNEELSARFMPQFVRGLIVGSVVVIGMIVVTFRNWRLVLLTLVPTLLGLLWAGGFLALVGYELDLFSVFAVITFIGIGVDYGVHLVHRYRERGDATRATAELASVILVAGAITLMGYGTLIGSSYPPLQSIGVVSVASVVALVAASVLVLPALMTFLRESGQ